MKIIIISDIHDNLSNLSKVLAWSEKKKIDKIICCGDLTNQETLKFLAKNFLKDIFLVKGNCSLFTSKDVNEFSNIKYFSFIGIFELTNKKIGICHEPFLINRILAKEECDYIFYGHTHKPWIEKSGKTKIVNPGTLGGVFQRASFAYWDIKKNKIELKILDLI